MPCDATGAMDTPAQYGSGFADHGHATPAPVRDVTATMTLLTRLPSCRSVNGKPECLLMSSVCALESRKPKFAVNTGKIDLKKTNRPVDFSTGPDERQLLRKLRDQPLIVAALSSVYEPEYVAARFRTVEAGCSRATESTVRPLLRTPNWSVVATATGSAAQARPTVTVPLAVKTQPPPLIWTPLAGTVTVRPTSGPAASMTRRPSSRSE